MIVGEPAALGGWDIFKALEMTRACSYDVVDECGLMDENLWVLEVVLPNDAVEYKAGTWGQRNLVLTSHWVHSVLYVHCAVRYLWDNHPKILHASKRRSGRASRRTSRCFSPSSTTGYISHLAFSDDHAKFHSSRCNALNGFFFLFNGSREGGG